MRCTYRRSTHTINPPVDAIRELSHFFFLLRFTVFFHLSSLITLWLAVAIKASVFFSIWNFYYPTSPPPLLSTCTRLVCVLFESMFIPAIFVYTNLYICIMLWVRFCLSIELYVLRWIAMPLPWNSAYVCIYALVTIASQVSGSKHPITAIGLLWHNKKPIWRTSHTNKKKKNKHLRRLTRYSHLWLRRWCILNACVFWFFDSLECFVSFTFSRSFAPIQHFSYRFPFSFRLVSTILYVLLYCMCQLKQNKTKKTLTMQRMCYQECIQWLCIVTDIL